MLIKETNVNEYSVLDTIRKMIKLAKKGGFTAKQEINGVTVMVNGDSNADLIFRDQQRAQLGYIKGVVGPYPKAELTPEEKANDRRIEMENERKRQMQRAAYEKEVRARRKKVEAKLANAPNIELADEVGWQKLKEINTDWYGAAVVTYAERWARLMQLEMANGKSLEEVAEATSHEADLEDITAFMYGCAVSALARYWKHGDRLRRWHNLKYQLGNEGEKANESGGVINPALLVLKSK